MENTTVSNHAAKLAADAIKELAPLAAPKNAFLAFAFGFAAGPVGVAIYFRSAKDFFICLAMLMLFSALMAFGPGELAGWMFSAGYGAWRAKTSNENRRIAGNRQPPLITDAQLMPPHPADSSRKPPFDGISRKLASFGRS